MNFDALYVGHVPSPTYSHNSIPIQTCESAYIECITNIFSPFRQTQRNSTAMGKGATLERSKALAGEVAA